MKDKELRDLIEQSGLLKMDWDGHKRRLVIPNGCSGISLKRIESIEWRLSSLFERFFRLIEHLGLEEREIPSTYKRTILVKKPQKRKKK